MASSVILGLLSIAALFPSDIQGITCNSELQCAESKCNTTANNEQFCTECSAGFGLLYNPPNATKCSECGNRCATCKVIGQVCSKCVTTFGPISSGSNTGSCGPCLSVANNCVGGCDVSGAGRCDSCDNGYGLTNGNTSCTPCVSNCLSCNTNITYCDLCAQLYYYYPNKTCGRCSDHCTQYRCRTNGAEKCDRCDNGYGLTSTNSCALCAANCTTFGCAVNGAGKCDLCDMGFNLTLKKTCTPICSPNCNESFGCISPNTCLGCNVGYGRLPNGTCDVCGQNCTTYGCLVNGPSKCDRCDLGFALQSLPINTCAPCSSNCAKYGCAVNGAGKCDRCDFGFVLTTTNTCTRTVQTTIGVSNSGESNQPSSGTTRYVVYGWTTVMTTWTTIPDQEFSTRLGGYVACPMLEVGLGIGVPCGFIIFVLLILIIVFCVQNRSLRAYKKESQDSRQIQEMDSTTSNAPPQPTSTQYQQLRMQDTQRDYERIEDKYDTISTTETEIGVISDNVNHVSRRATLLPSDEDRYDTISTAHTEITGQYETPIN